MGREASTRAEIAGQAADVRILLESSEIIVRGGIRRRYPRDQIVNVMVVGGGLRFECGGEAVFVHFETNVAENWAKAIVTPPPSLRAKLGLAEGALAFCLGAIDDAALKEAVAGAVAASIEQADMIIACISSEDDLSAAIKVHEKCPAIPIWAIYPKGKNMIFGETKIREILRASGLRDTKSCAVSDQLTAARYGRPAKV